MDHGGVGAELAVHGLRRFGVEAAVIEKDESLHPSVCWPRSWKARTSIRGVPPGFSDIDDSEDYMSGLAEEIAQCMLDETDDGSRVHGCPAFSSAESTWGTPMLSTSPQSTLAGMSSWDLLSPGASSSGGLSSGVSSPPTPVAATHGRNDEDDALDLLHAELLRLKMVDEMKARQQQILQMKQEEHFQQLLWKMRQRHAASLSYEGADSLKLAQGGAEYSMHSSTQKALGNVPCRKGRSETNQTRGRKATNGIWGGNQNQGIRHRNWCAAEQSIQVQPHPGAYASGGSQHKPIRGSGMRAVFLGLPGARESGGTGVFLPRRLGSGLDSRRKPACSTVLLPSRIVQALNLNVEDTLVPNIAPSGVFFRRDALAPARNSTVASQAVDPSEDWASRSAAACSPLQEVAPGICLPTEWTF